MQSQLKDATNAFEAILMHIVGNPTSCWSLTAHASRTLVALSYHTIRDPIPETDYDKEVHAAVAWCYHFDRCMSLLLLRPPSLPPLGVPVSSLVEHDPANPMSIFARVMLEMVPIHEKILELSLDNSQRRSPELRVSVREEVARLRKQMTDIYVLMENVCEKAAWNGLDQPQLTEIRHAHYTTANLPRIIYSTGRV